MNKSTPTAMADVASPALEKHIEESIATTVPVILAKFFSSGGFIAPQEPSSKNVDSSPQGNPTDEEATGPSNRGERFFSTEEDFELSSELLDLTTKAFTKPLTKEKWKDLSAGYPPIKGTESFLCAPTMEAGMKEEIRKSHGHRKTKEVFSFDDGLAEQQGPFLTVARPILAALMNLDSPPSDEGEGGPDPEVVREMLEDALVLLGNANARMNVWRQRRFSDYLTDLGRRTLREGIPTDRHLFPHQFHEKIKSEHDHKASTSKLICKPKTGPKPWSGSQSFRDSASFKRGQQSGADRKRKWAYQPRGASATFKYSKTSGGARRTSISNQSANNTNSS